MVNAMTVDWFARHRVMLELAASALVVRNGFSPYGDGPEDFPDWADGQGQQAFAMCCNAQFHIDQPSTTERVGEETSPYRGRLNILYPEVNVDQMFAGAVRASAAWSRVDVDSRTGLCLEALDRLRMRVFQLAYAVMHTTGAPFDLAFRFGGLQALARSLEAVTIAYQEQRALPVLGSEESAGESATFPKFMTSGRGVALVIGCESLPTWTGFPALFANVATGNAVIVKPHSKAVLPWAIAVTVLRETLSDAGFDSDLVALAVDAPTSSLAAQLSLREEIRLIDYTGKAEFGLWLAEHAAHARQWRFGPATNVVIVDSLGDANGFFSELARAASIFAGRLCVSPRVILIPRGGVRAADDTLDPERFVSRLAQHIEHELAGDALRVLGAIAVDEFEAEIAGATECGMVALESRIVYAESFPGARARSPLVLHVSTAGADTFRREWFGPLLIVLECEDFAAAVSWTLATARAEGLLRANVCSTDAGIQMAAFDALTAAGIDVNIHGVEASLLPMAFRDLHGTGMNRSATTTMGSTDFVVGRFRHVQMPDCV